MLCHISTCAEIKLVDVKEMGYTTADEEGPRGEIWIRGGNVSSGYLALPDKTQVPPPQLDDPPFTNHTHPHLAQTHTRIRYTLTHRTYACTTLHAYTTHTATHTSAQTYTLFLFPPPPNTHTHYTLTYTHCLQHALHTHTHYDTHTHTPTHILTTTHTNTKHQTHTNHTTTIILFYFILCTLSLKWNCSLSLSLSVCVWVCVCVSRHQQRGLQGWLVRQRRRGLAQGRTPLCDRPKEEPGQAPSRRVHRVIHPARVKILTFLRFNNVNATI